MAISDENHELAANANTGANKPLSNNDKRTLIVFGTSSFQWREETSEYHPQNVSNDIPKHSQKVLTSLAKWVTD